MQKNLDSLRQRLEVLLCGQKPYVWGDSIGWPRGTVDTAFRRGKPPGPRDLAQLATAERVNLTWLLTGAGVPYDVLPPPPLQAVAIGPEFSWYLFAGPEGLQAPLVRVGPGASIAVYNGSPVDLARVVEYLLLKDRPIYLAPDSDRIAGVRLGVSGNKALIDKGNGLLEGELTEIDPAAFRAAPQIEDRSVEECAGERDLLLLLRALPAERRETLERLARWLASLP